MKFTAPAVLSLAVRGVLLLCMAFAGLEAWAAPAGRLLVQLRVREGHMAVDPEGSRLLLNDEFKRDLRENVSSVERQLLDAVAKALRALGPISAHIDDPNKRAALEKSAALSLEGWVQSGMHYAAAGASLQLGEPSVLVDFGYAKHDALVALLSPTPLFLKDVQEGFGNYSLQQQRLDTADPLLGSDPALDPGQIVFHLQPPITKANAAVGMTFTHAAGLRDQTTLEKAVKARLNDLAGQLWWDDRIIAAVQEVALSYGYGITEKANTLGLYFKLNNDAATTEEIPARLEVRGPLRLHRLAMMFDGKALSDQVIYQFLSTSEFQAFRRNPSHFTARSGDRAATFNLDAAPALPARFLEPFDWAVIQARLATFDVISGLEDPDFENHTITAVHRASSQTDPPVTRLKRNYLEFSVTHNQGRPWQSGLKYTRKKLAGNDEISIKGGMEGEAEGDLTYARDYVGFGLLGRRLQVSIGAKSDFEPERRIASTSDDIRANRLNLAAELEVWRNRGGHWLTLDAQLAAEKAQLTMDTGAETDYSVRSVRFGAIYRYGAAALVLPLLTVESSFDLGRDQDTDRSYFGGDILLRTRRGFGAHIFHDLTVLASFRDDSTPAYLRLGLGGERSVRGFRTDAATGRFLWALQNELWFPLPATFRVSGKFESLLRRHVRTAAFLDLGGVGDRRSEFSRVRAGAGLGLRITHQFVTLKLDVAHPLNETRAVPGATSFYASLVIQPQF